MFSKALFKQSCKSNATMWAIITFALCFMLACVMLISGNGNIGAVRNAIQDTIITEEIDAGLQQRAISEYDNTEASLTEFDMLFSQNVSDTLSYLMWYSNMPIASDFDNTELYGTALRAWENVCPEMKTEAGMAYADNVNNYIASMPVSEGFDSPEKYSEAMGKWLEQSCLTQEAAVSTAYSSAIEQLQAEIFEKAKDLGYEEDSSEAQEMLGAVMYTVNPDGMFDEFYIANTESIPDDYDIMTLIEKISESEINDYILSEQRESYRSARVSECVSVFIAGNMSSSESRGTLIQSLSSYGVTEEKYNSFGYTYENIKHMSKNAIASYTGRLEYELEELEKKYENGEFASDIIYSEEIEAKKKELSSDISTSFLSTLPDEVSEALEEIGQADLYTLIVGSIFYKLAGLLLPIIYMIMASNNLVAGQVDSGSMAYVLSTSTKRSTVVFTQAIYLVGSLLAMFSLTTVTGCVCLSVVKEEVELTYSNLILLNIGAFLVLFTLSGLCFFTSCVFDRSKYSMAIGGGLSIFALVAAMLGLFGSPVIPSVVRLDALNNFNYATVISLFDVVSIMDGSDNFIIKFVVLAILGIIGYTAGSIRFTKKDLPL